MACAITQPVNLELVPDLAWTTLIRCLYQFMSRRDISEAFISDNAKVFKTKELKMLLGDNEIQCNSTCLVHTGGVGYLKG